MILILSSIDDQSTLEVIKWLNYYHIPWIKIDPDTPLRIIELVINNEEEEFIVETLEGTKIDSRNISAYWYRRGQISLTLDLSLSQFNHVLGRRKMENHLHDETKFLIDSLHLCLNQKKRLNSFNTAEPNKQLVLEEAKKVGLTIPPTLVTTAKNEFKKFEQKHGPLISKAIQNGIRFRLSSEDDWTDFLTYTEPFSETDLPDQFFPTLFQPHLKKNYELRIFYLNGDFYSMAIFSQNDLKTAVDFRQYNIQKPNRTVPYTLPHLIQHRLKRLMQALSLESGSIDMVVTSSDEFVFLEVNPVGQYGMVSNPCNYYLDQKIAHYLYNCT